jgi:ABC-type glutathione transport system ATPase component
MGLLSFSNVSKGYPDGARELRVLDDVSFDLAPGLAVGLYGARRAGKSTLLRLAAGIEPPDLGMVRFDGRDLAQVAAPERSQLLRGPIGLLSAADWSPGPDEGVLDHMAAALASDGASLADASRAALNALDDVGLDGDCGQRASASLSSDERSRVMLAMALARRPRLLLVDEPGPMPSLGERQRFCSLLRSLAGEREITLLVASDELSVLQGLQLLMSISAGRLCSSGEPSTVVELRRGEAGAGS